MGVVVFREGHAGTLEALFVKRKNEPAKVRDDIALRFLSQSH